MIKHLLTLAKAAFVLTFAALVIVHKMHSARILVLHSYDAEYSWTREENEGINRYFSKHPGSMLHWHYMDLKKHQDEDFRRAATTTAINTIERWKPDVIILLDDIAQELIGKRYRNHPRIKLVFAGVNARPEKYGYHTANNVTGILERKPLRAVDDAIGALWRNIGSESETPRVVLLGDKSFDFAASQFEYRSPASSLPHLRWVPPLTASTFEEWKMMVFRAATVADFILVSDYRQLRREPGSKEFVPAATVMSWTEQNARIPVVGLTTASTQDGGMLGVAAAGYEQGWEASRMAHALATGTHVSELPMITGQQSVVSIRKSALLRRGFEMPFVYEAFARAKDLQFE